MPKDEIAIQLSATVSMEDVVAVKLSQIETDLTKNDQFLTRQVADARSGRTKLTKERRKLVDDTVDEQSELKVADIQRSVAAVGAQNVEVEATAAWAGVEGEKVRVTTSISYKPPGAYTTTTMSFNVEEEPSADMLALTSRVEAIRRS